MGLDPKLWAPVIARLTGKVSPAPDAPISRRREEDRIQIAIAQYLDARRFFFFSVPNERKASVVTHSILKAMGLRKGVADLVVWDVRNRSGFIEVKTEAGRLSVDQREFRDECLARGLPWGLARSADDVVELLGEWGFEP